jgi:hypothetical protein
MRRPGIADATPGTRFLLMAGQPYGSCLYSTGRSWIRRIMRNPVADRMGETGTRPT